MVIDVMIPVYKPQKDLRELIYRLKKQTMSVRKIYLVNTEEKYWRDEWISGFDEIEVIHIHKQEFDHGETRKRISAKTDADYFVWMTQDALPADADLIRFLYQSFSEKTIAVYARQLPKPECGFLENYARRFNYPEQSKVKSLEDEKEMGIKAYFLSDVCAMYRRSAYEAVGGFPSPAIFNEDMIFSIRALRRGYQIVYCAEARVYHSHNYKNWQLFQRNFDLGVSQKQYEIDFAGIRSESEGIRMVGQTAGYLIRSGKWYLLGKLFMNSAAKYMGYRLGKEYQRLPKWMIQKCSMNSEYWKK